MKIHLLALAAFALPLAAYAHPGHGTAPAADATAKAHVHFGTPKAPAAAPRALPAGDTSAAKRSGAAPAKRKARQELSHTY
jgi:hypothetical protein